MPTSERTAALCRELGVPLSTRETPELDLTIDGADEIDPQLGLIKGGGGALLREKIVAAASEDAGDHDASSWSTRRKVPAPIEVNEFGPGATKIAIAKAAAKLGLEVPRNRMTNGIRLLQTVGI